MLFDMLAKAHTIRINSWNDFVHFYDTICNKDGTWIFRGQRDANWGLSTSLHRTFLDFGIQAKNAERTEVGLVCRFKRQAHLFTGISLPNDHEVIEWMALMQHFGAPTRLQDWTYSIFVAAHFALESASGESAIWAIRRDLLFNNTVKLLGQNKVGVMVRHGYKDTAENFATFFGRKRPVAHVLPVNPYRMNGRLSIQQGLFLVPGDITVSFEENLAASIGDNLKKHDVFALRFDGSRRFRSEALARLYDMNITTATLFPGLDGFAQSLRGMLAKNRIIPSSKSWRTELGISKEL